MDSYDRNAATANVKHMLRIMDQAAKPNQASEVGFDEARIIDLYRLWLIVGSWMRTPDYAQIYGTQMQLPRAPRPAPGGAKYSTLLHVALKQLAHINENDNDTKHRRSSFDLAHDRMFDPAYVKLHYVKHWS